VPVMPGVRLTSAMIEPGKKSHVDGMIESWLFLDIGFSRDARSSGFLVGDGQPTKLQFGQAKQEIIKRVAASATVVKLVIEAPLSVCFSKQGNPKGRSIEEDGSRTRYCCNGLGCSVMVAARNGAHNRGMHPTARKTGGG